MKNDKTLIAHIIALLSITGISVIMACAPTAAFIAIVSYTLKHC